MPPPIHTEEIALFIQISALRHSMLLSTKSDLFPSEIIIPNLGSYLGNRFRLQISRYHKSVAVQSKKWWFHMDPHSEEKLEAYSGLKPALLVSVCYPESGQPQMKVITDFLTYLFYFDNISDDMDAKSVIEASNIVMNSLHHMENFRTSARIGIMAKDFYRHIKGTSSPGAQRRFLETMEMFFQSVDQQSRDRTSGLIPDPESYVSLRRDTSGCKSCFALIEYCRNLDIPDEVMEHPLIRKLEDSANDLVSWSNDIYSFRREFSKGDTHNMITVVMKHQGLGLQEAVDYVADLCKKSIDDFCSQRAMLPTWNRDIDRQVNAYVDGLASWIVGILYWSFKTERYFGKDANSIGKTLVVTNIRPSANLRKP